MSEEDRRPQPIYLSPPDVRGREKELLLEALESNWIAPLGPQVDAFERELADYVGVANATALSSGTAALHLALLLLGVERGDFVFVSSLTFVASANAIRYVGAEPVFIDSNESSWNMCPARLEEALKHHAALGKLPKAILAVDLYGHCADYDALIPLASRYGIPIIEDAAEALGASYGNRKAGALGTIGIFSFNGNKIITTSGGGMLVSDNAEFTERARHLATQARMPVAHYEHEEVGFNYRLSNLLAAVGRAQLETLDERIAARRAIRKRYTEHLAGLPGLSMMPEPDFGGTNAWLTCVRVNSEEFGASRDEILSLLAQEKIEARPVWKPMHLQPLYSGCPRFGGEVAQALFEDGLCLPSGSNLSAEQVDRIATLVAQAPKRMTS